MRSRLIWILGSWLFAAPVFAQSTSLPVSTADEVPGTLNAPFQDTPFLDALDTPVRQPTYPFWVRAEYLAYWVKSAPQPISLVTGNSANPTQELFSSDQNFGMFSGFRVGVGAWFGNDNIFGWDGSFFMLQQRTSTFTASSNAAGSPTLAFPFANQTPGAVGDTLLPVSSPGVFAGSVRVASTLQLWGAETNAVLSLMNTGDFRIVALGGLRYADLSESLNIGTVSNDILTAPTTMLSQNDMFCTHNQFYGGQIGGRFTWQTDRFSIDLTGKIAAGVTQESVNIQGSSTQTGPGGINGTYAGGVFTQASNIGHYAANQFSVIPSAELKFSYFITPRLRAFAGYDFMYWTNVVRPGNQVDRNINLTQSAIYGTGSLTGPASPAPLFNRSDFWAQGLNLGFEFRF